MSTLEHDLKQKLSWPTVILKSITVVLIGAAIASWIGMSLCTNEQDRLVNKASREATINAKLQGKMIQNELGHMAHSLLFFGAQVNLHQATFSEHGLKQLEEDFLAYMNTNTNMDQVRLLDTTGMEIARADYNNRNPVIKDKSQLQNKSDRDYFKQMQLLEPGELYVSDLNLNMEHGKVEIPLKPVVRMGLRIDDKQGGRSGYLIINYLANSFLDRFKESEALSLGDMQLINSSRTIVSSPKPEHEWKDASLHIPEQVWKSASESETGTVKIDNDLYLFSNLYLEKTLRNTSPVLGLEGKSGLPWKTIVLLSDAHLLIQMKPYQDLIIKWIAAVVVLLLLVSIPLLTLLERKKITVSYFNLLEQAIQNSSDSVMITDLKGRIKFINPSFTALTGYAAAEAIGRNPSQLLKSHVQKQSFYKHMWETISNGNVWSSHLVDRRKDGSLFPADLTIAPVLNSHDQIENYVATMRDDTENQLLQEQLLNKKKMQSLSISVGGIAHEFNNILAGLMGNTYLIKSVNKDNAGVLAKLEAIESLGHKAAGMIQQMLTYVGEGHQISLSRIDVAELYTDIVDELAQNTPANISLNRTISPTPIMVEADAAALRHVLDELISNAIDAVEGCLQPEISIELATETCDKQNHDGNAIENMRDFAVLTVKDNGTGIDPDHMDLLFAPFFTTKEVGSGTGLGLADVYGTINKHHGFIDVSSELEIGTTFRIFLPTSFS